MVSFTKKSPFTRIEHTMSFNVTPEVFEAAYTAWANGEKLIQDAFPFLNAGEREFIKTGITPQEWDNLFGPDEEND
jgi:hypothetical protein